MSDTSSTVKNRFGFLFITVNAYECALVWKRGKPEQLLAPGEHRLSSASGERTVEFFSRRLPWLKHASLDILETTDFMKKEAQFLNLGDSQRSLVWIDGRFSSLLGPGLHAWWLGQCAVHHEIVDITDNDGRFAHAQLENVARHKSASTWLRVFTVGQDAATVRQINGQNLEVLPPGRYAYWHGGNDAQYTAVELREQTLDISGQDIMTADKITLRLNVSLSYRVTDPVKFITVAADVKQALYREAQLVLRAAVGGRELEALLGDKETLDKELRENLGGKAAQYGLEVGSLGVRDIILPGEMKILLNKVMEAKKAAEAALIARREETAAMRHQLNSARMLADNPALMRLRELECLEKVAASSELKVLLSDKGLAEKITTMI